MVWTDKDEAERTELLKSWTPADEERLEALVTRLIGPPDTPTLIAVRAHCKEVARMAILLDRRTPASPPGWQVGQRVEHRYHEGDDGEPERGVIVAGQVFCVEWENDGGREAYFYDAAEEDLRPVQPAGGEGGE